MARRAGVRTNISEVAADLDRLGDDFAKEALIPAMRDFTRDVARTARTTGFRSRSGRLARSIVADEPKPRPNGRVRGSVSSDTPYSGRIEYAYGGRHLFLRAALRKLAPRYSRYIDAAVEKFIRKRGF